MIRISMQKMWKNNLKIDVKNNLKIDAKNNLNFGVKNMEK